MIELHSKLDQYLIERVILLLHFLVVASALFCFSSPDEVGHTFEDFVSAAQVFVDKMFAMELKEPMVKFILLSRPMSFLDVSGFLLSAFCFGV